MTIDVFLVIMAFGLVAAGLTHSAWNWLGYTQPGFASVLANGSLLAAPLRVLGVMLAAPLILAGSAIRMLDHGWRYAGITAMGLVAAAMWCFMTGIVVLVGLDVLISG